MTEDKNVDAGTTIQVALGGGNIGFQAALANLPPTGTPESSGTVSLGAVPAGAPSQAVIPGSVSSADIQRVFNKFVDWVGWDNPELVPAAKKKLMARSKRLQLIREKIQAQLDRLDSKLQPVLFQLRSPEEMKAEATEFLTSAVEKMGTLGSCRGAPAGAQEEVPQGNRPTS